MISHKDIVKQYMDSYNELDHKSIFNLLDENVEWIVPGAFHLKGSKAFIHEVEHHEYDIAPKIKVLRLTEENNVVIAEGKVTAKHKGGDVIQLLFCDIFELKDGKISKLTSYLAPDNI